MHNSALQQTGLMFLRSAIERILADRDIKRKENLQLKKACENVLGESLSIRRFFLVLARSISIFISIFSHRGAKGGQRLRS